MMRNVLLVVLNAGFATLQSQAQIVSDIDAQYRHGQIFITWRNIVNCDTGFYYVYASQNPITDTTSFKAAQYLGRVPYNFSWDYRLSYALNVPGNNEFLVINDTPLTVVDTFHNVFVMNCTQEGVPLYFAVRAGCNKAKPAFYVAVDSNATSQPTLQHVEPIKAYLQKANVPVPGSSENETMDIYIHYGSNVAVGNYPEMTNEGCLPFHFGIVKSGPAGGLNAGYLKFHGGKGNLISNMITAYIPNSWKIGFDDWIPSFNFDAKAGFNTRWFGYSEFFDVYKTKKNTTPPSTGVVKAYTYHRLLWELDWILRTFPNSIDTTRMYLVGNSQGCAAVILLSMLNPDRFAASNLSESRFWVAAPDDANPDCKFNEGNSARKETRVLWGNEDETNLPTNVPMPGDSTEVLRIYDLTNAAYMLHLNRYRSLPFLRAINGKEDKNTCWQEKITFYDSVTRTRCGGEFMWDLREHSGGSNNAWPSLSPSYLLRFRSNQSYPAFSHCSTNGDPGSNDILTPPYYNGDPVGSLHANFDWIGASIVDSSALWQVLLFVHQEKLNNGQAIPERLPEFGVTDVTIRRAQHFKNFPAGTELCWFNFHRGRIVQAGKLTQQYDGDQAVPITIPRVHVYPDGSLLRVMLCSLVQ